MPRTPIPSLFAALFLAACAPDDTTNQPYYTSRDDYYAAADRGAAYADWCGRQTNEAACAPVVVKTVNLEAIARAEIFNAKARLDAGNKTGFGIAQLSARAAIRRLCEYVAAHPIPDQQ
jgi:hypothetical protein